MSSICFTPAGWYLLGNLSIFKKHFFAYLRVFCNVKNVYELSKNAPRMCIRNCACYSKVKADELYL